MTTENTMDVSLAEQVALDAIAADSQVKRARAILEMAAYKVKNARPSKRAELEQLERAAQTDVSVAEARARAAWQKITEHVITIAVEPRRQAAMQRAREAAQAVANRYMDLLREHDMDAQAAAPYPSGSLNRVAYLAAKGRHDMVRHLTSPADSSPRSYGGPDYRKPNPAAVEAFKDAAAKEASSAYTAFIWKLVGKIGDCTAATLAGDHVWGFSTLTVTKADGTIERWRTQTIINTSSLGTIFNQYPTRKVK